jgi:hypothetical protein
MDNLSLHYFFKLKMYVMKKKLMIIVSVFFLFTGYLFAQESEWEPQKNITGYIGLEGDNFFNLENYSRDYGISISEAGILASYRPTKKLTLKSVIVYRPNYSIDQIVNEVNAEYKFADLLTLKAGRFLTPLSPMNTYYYAPVNNSATLPMVITCHEFFSLNVDAVSINGKYGEAFKIDYDIYGGGFRNALWVESGALGLFGVETQYFSALHDTSNRENSNLNTPLQIGGGGRIGFAFRDYMAIGFGMFHTDEAVDYTMNDVTMTLKLKKHTYGGNLKVKYSTLKLIAEYWQYKMEMEGFTMVDQKPTKTTFAELSNTFGKTMQIIPYVRYEIYKTGSSTRASGDINRFTIGINFKPNFETSFKLEYLYYKNETDSETDKLNGIVGNLTYSF